MTMEWGSDCCKNIKGKIVGMAELGTGQITQIPKTLTAQVDAPTKPNGVPLNVDSAGKGIMS